MSDYDESPLCAVDGCKNDALVCQDHGDSAADRAAMQRAYDVLDATDLHHSDDRGQAIDAAMAILRERLGGGR